MKKKFPNVLLALLMQMAVYSVFGQNEFSKWYFGFAGLDFNTQPPTALLNNGTQQGSWGVTTMCDANGNLLFYANGSAVYNSAHVVMANGNGLNGSGAAFQAIIAVKQPGNSNIYYLFTNDASGGPTGWEYSIVDMSLAAGMGSVTVKNATIYAPTCDRQVAVRHCNGRDVWIISHDYNSNQFRAVLLTPTGLSINPVISAIGHTLTGQAAGGCLKASPDGGKLVMALSTNGGTVALDCGFQLFDFDPATGVVSNSLSLLTCANYTSGTRAYDAEFSPDGTKLYGLTWNNPIIFQWNLCAPNATALSASQYSLSLPLPIRSIQRAIDGKLYVGVNNSQTMSVINNPNASGAAMGFSANVINLGMFGGLALPNNNPWEPPRPNYFASTLSCQSGSFAAPTPTASGYGCTTGPYAPFAWKWNFGDPSSGSANTSTLSSVQHSFSSAGNYTVSLILYGTCRNDTIRKIVPVTAGPNPVVSGTFVICKGSKKVFTANGGTSYNWSNGTSGTTATLSPTATTIYTLTATLNGCQAQRAFTVTVDPCLGIEETQGVLAVQVYPNPAKDQLQINVGEGNRVQFIDMNGKVVLDKLLTDGTNTVDIQGLVAGVYTLYFSTVKATRYQRLVKLQNE